MLQQQVIEEEKAKPFLRWAGGKRRLLKEIENYIPEKFNDYHEPFLGGGSVFFHLSPTNKCYLSDLNKDLINTYIQIRDNVDKVITGLEEYKNTKRFYYEVRKNNETGKIKQAVRFIYLNRTSFNGIYRVNRDGKYNVPYGYRKKINVVDKETLLIASERLQGVILKHQDFGKSLAKVKEGDLVFLDPPYTVAHENNGFIAYNQKIFSWQDQVRLKEVVTILERRGVYFIVTNAYHQCIKDLYNNIGGSDRLERFSVVGKLIPIGESRKAKVISAVCYCDGKNIKIFIGETIGKISDKGRGSKGFQFDPIFIPTGSSITYAEMDLKEKMSFSQATKSYGALIAFLKTL
ncbi:MAG: Dam family site-specific DNA-(adenine-N6)-methyltransferase [Bacteroidetes bacterium]|nr:Dam family site-specific DNA-(adenine-N6)-methyltransferase [Bacteroidota bacterium]